MKSIHYVSDEFVTGDDIADALVMFAEALARNEASVAVDVPVRFGDSSVRQVSFLLGPASQLVAVPVDSEFDEVVDTKLVDWLKNETESLGRVTARYVDDIQNLDDYGL